MRRFLNGLLFGAGVGVALAIIHSVYIFIVFPKVIETAFKEEVIDTPPSPKNEVLDTAPKIEKSPRFLDSKNLTWGNFTSDRKTLIAGPGSIVGTAISNGTPVEGLKLRLALNGSVWSAWATTDETGTYRIPVPYGQYEVNGFELNNASADRVLAGKISAPRSIHKSSSVFEVTESMDGTGTDFVFLDPIAKYIPKEKYSLSDEIIINWSAHPKAEEYEVQLMEQSNGHFLASSSSVFDWESIPKTKATSLNLSASKELLKVNYFYRVQITAYDKRGEIVSQTPDRFGGVDFEIVE